MTDDQWDQKLDELGDSIDKQLQNDGFDEVTYFLVLADNDGYHSFGYMPPEMVVQACIAMTKAAEQLLAEEQHAVGPTH